MKRFTPLLLLLLILSSCAETLDEQTIVGTWKITDFNSNAELSPMIIEEAKKMALTGKYDFKTDGSYTYMDDFLPVETTGSFTIGGEGKTLKLNSYSEIFGESSVTYDVENYTGESMKWKEDMGELGINTYQLERQ